MRGAMAPASGKGDIEDFLLKSEDGRRRVEQARGRKRARHDKVQEENAEDANMQIDQGPNAEAEEEDPNAVDPMAEAVPMPEGNPLEVEEAKVVD